MTGQDALESDALRAFAVFAERLNFTTAAADLHISQPSLHVKIRKLGEVLGVRLYQRRGRGLELTTAGQQLATFAADNARRTDDFLAGLREQATGVTISAGRGTFRWVIGDGIRRLVRSGRTVRVRTAGREAGIAALRAGRIDVTVVAHDPPPADLSSAQLAAYRQVLLIDPRHRLGRRDRVEVADLDGLNLVLPPPERPHRRALDLAMLEAGVTATVRAEVEGWDLLLHFAELGIGATVVNGCVRPPARLATVPVVDLPAVRYWMLWRPERAELVTDLLPLFGIHLDE